jgi:hypothetical protein
VGHVIFERSDGVVVEPGKDLLTSVRILGDLPQNLLVEHLPSETRAKTCRQLRTAGAELRRDRYPRAFGQVRVTVRVANGGHPLHPHVFLRLPERNLPVDEISEIG